MSTTDVDPREPDPSKSYGQGAARSNAWSVREDEIVLARILNALKRHKIWFVVLPSAMFVLFEARAILQPREYVAAASFTPQESSGARTQLAGLAAQFGVSLAEGQSGQSPAFYAALLRSRDVLREAVQTRYDFVADGKRYSGTLMDLYKIPTDAPALRAKAAAAHLHGSITVETSRETGIIEFTVRAPWPALAEQIAARLLALVNDFNLRTRQTRAVAEGRFIEERLEQARTELRRAENELQSFLLHNRQVTNSPSLLFEQERLQRNVKMRQDVFTSLAQGYEQVRIDGVRNTPVISALELPDNSALPQSRRLIQNGVLGIALGAALALVIAALRDLGHFTGERSNDKRGLLAWLRRRRSR